MGNEAVGRLDRAIRAAGIQIDGVSPRPDGGWRVWPPEQQAAAQPIIDAFDPDDPRHAVEACELTATAEARRTDIIATCALMVLQRDRTAWNAMTGAQNLNAVRAEVSLWKGLRVFLHDKAL